jgi:4-hydroxyphenylacetate 3-hydroxylase, reductase component
MQHAAAADPTSANSALPDPARPPGTEWALDPLSLRRALGSFGTGVTVVTTLGANGQLVGVTANSFSSVSLSPPIVLWSLNRSSLSLAAFDHSGRFVVNVLALDQVAVSRRFSKPAPNQQADRFSGMPHRHTAHGLPLLLGCAASFECSTEQRLEVGDHILFLGRVEAFEHHPSAGLLFCQGHYAQAAAINAHDATQTFQPHPTPP